MKKNLLYLILLLVIVPKSLHAQYYFYNDRYYDNPVLFEIGVTGGIMNAMTDLGGKNGPGKKGIKDIRWATAKPSYGAYVMVSYKNAISGRLEGTSGTVVGYDSILKVYGAGTNPRYERNQSFKSQISEIQFCIEAHPLLMRNMDGIDVPRLSPYLVLGAGFFSFDPQAKIGNSWYSLKALHTEGQGFSEYPDRKEYNLKQYNLIGGLGIRVELNSLFNARLEVLDRKLFTDYLDDVSTTYIDPDLFNKYLSPVLATVARQLADRRKELDPAAITNPGDKRGNPSRKDNYFTIQLKLGITLGRIVR